jgi:hypothetical protein
MKIRLGRRWLPQTMAGIAVVGLLAACTAGSRESTAPAPASTAVKDGIGAPAPEFGPVEQPNAQRDVVKSASMTITVSNTSDAADKAAVIVEDADGRVDSRSEDAGSGRGRANTSVVLRVPAAKLDEVMRQLKALQASVDRLLAIMRDAKDPDALIKAEAALSARQAELDSLHAQRDQLGARIDYSTVDVNFVADQIVGPNRSSTAASSVRSNAVGTAWCRWPATS